MKTDELISQLVDEAKPVKRLWHPALRVGAWLLVSFAWLFGLIFLVWGFRNDLAMQFEHPLYVAEIVLSFLTAVSSGAAASWLAVPDARGKSWLRFIPLVVLIPLVGLCGYILVGTPNYPKALLLFDGRGLDCVFDILLFSLVPAVMLYFMVKKAATTHYYWMSGLALLAVGSFAYMCQRLIEKNDDMVHIFQWHIAPILLLSLIGIMLGRSIWKW